MTQYFKDKAALVLSVKCPECGAENFDLLQLMQERENNIWKLYGGKSPVVWFDQTPTRYWATLVDADNPQIKRVRRKRRHQEAGRRPSAVVSLADALGLDRKGAK